MPGSVVTSCNNEVVHANQAKREHRHHEEAGCQAADPAHPSIVTQGAGQRAPRPLRRL